jgi:MoxR-like ATPase
VAASRNPEIAGLGQLTKYISYGGSPRATINLALAAKAHAFLERRAFVIPEDVRAISMDVLRHRIGLTYEAEADGVTAEKVIEQLIQRVEVP